MNEYCYNASMTVWLRKGEREGKGSKGLQRRAVEGGSGGGGPSTAISPPSAAIGFPFARNFLSKPRHVAGHCIELAVDNLKVTAAAVGREGGRKEGREEGREG